MSKRKDIIKALGKVLEQIDGNAPYLTSIGDNVQLHARSLTDLEAPGVAVSVTGGSWPANDERDPITNKPYAAAYRRMSIQLVAVVSADIEAATMAGLDMLDDIERALKVNVRHVDLVDETGKRLARLSTQDFEIEDRPDGIGVIALTFNLQAEFMQ